MPTTKTPAAEPNPKVDHAKVHAAQTAAGEQLEAERLQRIEARDNPPAPDVQLAMALVAFQTQMPRVPKSKSAVIPGKDGRPGYRYSYADLADLTAVATPLLTRHDLAFVCLPRKTDAGAYELVGRLVHKGGGYLEGSLPIAGRQAQDIGSSLTYNRRYLLGCMTGIVTDDDEDGTLAQAAQEALAPEPPPWTGPPAPALVDRLVELAEQQNTDLATITAKFRADHQNMPVAELETAEPARLANLIRRIEDYIAAAGQTST